MNIAELASARYTTKAFDPSKKIPAEQVAQLETLLRLAPSSVNSQPWHFFIASSEEGKALVAKGTPEAFSYNEPKVRNASHVVVLCARDTLSPAHLDAVLAKEDADGRFATPEAKAGQSNSRGFYAKLHQETLNDEGEWMSKQVYIALGTLLLGAAALGIDACPIEGFDAAKLSEAMDLPAKGLKPLVLCALGYRSEADFNAKLPKSRLAAEQVITRL